MNDEHSDDTLDRDHFECIDQDLGRELWRLDDPATDPVLREKLHRHGEHCDACRILLALDAEIESAVRDGEIEMPSLPATRSRWPQIILGSGALALAASLTLMAVLPPHARLGRMTTREQGAPTIERPVADEIIVSSHPTISWSPIAGARAYDVSVRSTEGDYAWSGRAESESIRIPAGDALPQDRRFRVAVVPVPATAAPEGGLNSSFRRGSLPSSARYRVVHGDTWLQALGLAGVLAISGGLGAALRRRLVHG